MAFRRSNAFNPDVNEELLRLIEGFQYDPYTVQATSGYRPGDKRQHGQHNAIDIEMIDPKSGTRLGNYQDPKTFGAYQQYANALYKHAQQTNPELAKRLRWGGYFSGGKGKYGALDLMHFDTAGDKIGMAGGSWEGGLTPEQAKLWGLQPGAGGAQLDAQMKAAGYTPEQRRNAIASIESAGSGDYGALGAWTGDPSDGRDRAYGRYQVMGSNVGPWAQQYLGKSGVTADQFLKDPALQDQLFDAVYGDYVTKHGERGAASKWFTGSPDEPNRTDVNGKLTGGTYADRYMAALGAPPAAADSPSESAGGPGTGTAPAASPAAAKPWWQKMLKDVGSAAGNFGSAPQQPIAPVAPNPAAAVVRGQPMSPINPENEERKRAQLAEAMARLNSGRLV